MTDEEYISNISKIETDELFQQLESFGNDPYYGDLWVAVVDELKRRIEERPKGEWIPVSERLPKYNKTVLISVKQIGKEARVFTAQRRKRFKTPDIFECCTDNDGWWDFRISAWDDHEVLAWMPLPESYKAES